MEENKHYDCKTCVNRGSPLCELCTNITSPSGKEHKPKFYIAQSEVQSVGGRGMFHEKPSDDPQTEKLAKYLMRLLCQRVPLPTSVVLEYNQKTEKEE
jgi:hypothetical protein